MPPFQRERRKAEAKTKSRNRKHGSSAPSKKAPAPLIQKGANVSSSLKGKVRGTARTQLLEKGNSHAGQLEKKEG